MELQDLVESVERTISEPLPRVAAAVEMSRELNRVGDQLVVHFVDEARAAGASWADIGAQLGVTKQAAQQRFVTRTVTQSEVRFDRWTERARRALAEAQRAAQRLGHTWLGTEHILLGVLAVPESVGALALAALGIEAAPVEARVLAAIGGPAEPNPVEVPFTPRAKKVLEMTVGRAAGMGHNYVGAEHLVLALTAEREGVAGQVLADLGVTEARLEERVIGLLTGKETS